MADLKIKYKLDNIPLKQKKFLLRRKETKKNFCGVWVFYSTLYISFQSFSLFLFVWVLSMCDFLEWGKETSGNAFESLSIFHVLNLISNFSMHSKVASFIYSMVSSIYDF